MLSSPPPTSSYTALAMKRQSLSGPKPLQLVEGQVSSPASPRPAPSSFRDPNVRRQSSISYNNTDSTDRPRMAKRNSWNGTPQETRPTTPLTLVEKHADLLQFIAQKESKCLDLRSQLAAHEAELLQLKKKWERIVERSYSKTHPSAAYNPESPSASLYTTASLSYLDSLVTNTGKLLGLPHTPSLSVSSSTTESSSSTDVAVASTKRRRPDDILIVTDTGATPLCSPNSEFEAYFGDNSTHRSNSLDIHPSPSDLRPRKPKPPTDPQRPPSRKRMSLPVLPREDVWLKKWDALSKSPMEIPKRASIFFSHLSQVVSVQPPTLNTNANTNPTSPSLLDEAVPPISSSPALVPAFSPSRVTTPKVDDDDDDDDDEWNW
ncbi:hypothetical protein E1B28_008419 [Marasmius oreades]|uniref:Uncharacterized protein n=1 Tax=Marasmius oreades TaxID=181124 RepID=A0A9P7RZY2_9AGAR|nr:uncharacterized protein E1B28_008419 [Marasmius oreades]KAG7092038.1 hypothetical protein E1B28_008419 [Marasmius oreades]